jgi:glycosyltransferase involved in cell wall biosynthesis
MRSLFGPRIGLTLMKLKVPWSTFENAVGSRASVSMLRFREDARPKGTDGFEGTDPTFGVSMRTLVIADDYPWPENSGSRIRLLTTLQGLTECGPTELFSIIPSARTDFDLPDPSLGLAKVGRIGHENHDRSGIQLLSALVRTSMPTALPSLDRSKVRSELEAFATGRYDLVWCFGARAWVLAGEPPLASTVLDLYDLEDQKILARLSLPKAPRPGVVGRVHDRGAHAFSMEEVRRWRRLHRRAAGRTRTIVVCSQLDADRLRKSGVHRAEVVPNGYGRVDEPVGRVAVESPPTILFQGTLRYPPNAQAARYLVEEVGPLLRDLIPDARIRLVGPGTPAMSALDDPPRVTMVGQVPDIGVELARADLVVVPIRFGSGTRVKILEAFAQRVPVVSTTLGAEGLDAQDGEHLLIGDSPDSIAAACARLLTDSQLRQRIVDSAHKLFLERYQRDRVVEAVRRVAREAAAR